MREACIRAVLNAKVDCEKYGMPLMVEPLVMKQSGKGGYEVNGDIEKIIPLVRQAVELGADVIKADPSDDASQYHEVIQTATGIPVLVRGGGTCRRRRAAPAHRRSCSSRAQRESSTAATSSSTTTRAA